MDSWSIQALGEAHQSIRSTYEYSTFQGTLLSQGFSDVLNPESKKKSSEFYPLHQKALHSGAESLREEIILAMFFLHFGAYQ